MKNYLILFSLFMGINLFSQDISFGKSKFDLTGDAGSMVTPDFEFTNSGSDTIEVFVNRFYKNLPTNWTSCFCFIQCHPPTEDTLHFFLAPGEKATIGVGFNTDLNPGIGYVDLTVEQVGGTQKDTLHFSGSTLLAGIKENSVSNTFNLFPNPVAEKLIINSSFNESYSVSIINNFGQVVEHFPDLSGAQTELSLSSLSNGTYFISLKYQSGKTETKKIQKVN